jgi:MoaA/NifB/PqqE/SkfB family radical SAM enzyme
MKKHTLARDLYQKTRLYWAVLKAQRSQNPVPVITNLYVTGACQARCVYCYVEMVGENDSLTSEQRKAKSEGEREFTLGQWQDVIDSLYDRGMRFVALAGGEPLIYHKIDELIEHITSKNIFLNLSSNAFLIEKHIDAAKSAAEVSISIDGDLVSNDKNRGDGYFEQAVRGIDKAIDSGVRIRLLTVVTQHNYDQIDWLIKFAEERNTCITFTPMLDAPEIRQEASLEVRLEDEKIREFFKKLKDVKKHSSQVINSVESMDYMINYPIKYGGIIWKDSPHASYYPQPCPYGRFQFLLTNRGELFPCAVMWNNKQHFQPKNVMDVGIDEALHNASNGLKCQSCSFANGPDWNSVTGIPWLLYGLKMTVKQALIHSRANGHVPGKGVHH